MRGSRGKQRFEVGDEIVVFFENENETSCVAYLFSYCLIFVEPQVVKVVHGVSVHFRDEAAA